MFIGYNTNHVNLFWNRIARIQNGAQVLPNNTVFLNDDEGNNGCEIDYTSENTAQRMDEYLKHRKKCLLKYCGDVCNTRAESGKDDIQKNVDDKSKKVGELESGNYANLHLNQKSFDCQLLFQSAVHDLPSPSFMSKPLRDIPDILKADYLYNGRIKYHKRYMDSNFPTNRTSKITSIEDYGLYTNKQWSKKTFDQKIKAVKAKDWDRIESAYGGKEAQVLHDTLILYKDKIVGKKALVIGSETPWIEAMILALGADHVTTLEYNKIVSTHPQHDAILPSDLSEKFKSNGYKALFDVIVSYSSLEHSGLTRYGDAPHPWGDLVTMAKSWCFTANDGMAFIGIPTSTANEIYFNAHRYYGSLMLSHLFTNWKLEFASWPFEVGNGKQVTFALKKNGNL